MTTENELLKQADEEAGILQIAAESCDVLNIEPQTGKRLASLIKALADEVRGEKWQPIIEATDEEVIGCIKYQKGKYGEPFACVYNEESDQYESIRITELKPHLPTHFTPLPTP